MDATTCRCLSETDMKTYRATCSVENVDLTHHVQLWPVHFCHVFASSLLVLNAHACCKPVNVCVYIRVCLRCTCAYAVYTNIQVPVRQAIPKSLLLFLEVLHEPWVRKSGTAIATLLHPMTRLGEMFGSDQVPVDVG